jgi:hypothetical protein
MGSLGFLIGLNLTASLVPGVDSASNRNEYQEYLLGVKADNFITCMYRLSRNLGRLSLLKPEWPVQACTGIPLSFKFI